MWAVQHFTDENERDRWIEGLTAPLPGRADRISAREDERIRREEAAAFSRLQQING
jgi:hypothetical protein